MEVNSLSKFSFMWRTVVKCYKMQYAFPVQPAQPFEVTGRPNDHLVLKNNVVALHVYIDNQNTPIHKTVVLNDVSALDRKGTC